MQRFPQGLKPRFLLLFMARLKPCPFKTLFFAEAVLFRKLSSSLKPCPFKTLFFESSF
ncbi:hypothetical protein HDF17_000960 [Granulicella arctica]|uniref:Uncharacterized protein n=1 Tax=Granulicella arctica TaxID=940613 RepID=A0A7Y9TS21_9BACT|nr:hypothetical protein [Granulicella arctica]